MALERYGQCRIDFWTDNFDDDTETKLYELLKQFDFQNIIISNEADNPEVFM